MWIKLVDVLVKASLSIVPDISDKQKRACPRFSLSGEIYFDS